MLHVSHGRKIQRTEATKRYLTVNRWRGRRYVTGGSESARSVTQALFALAC